MDDKKVFVRQLQDYIQGHIYQKITLVLRYRNSSTTSQKLTQGSWVFEMDVMSRMKLKGVCFYVLAQ